MNRQPHVIQQRRGFTLIELLAVVLIICILVGVVVGLATYVTRTAAVARAKGQMAAMQAALEAYKGDVGYYPVSSSVRFSNTGFAQITNSACLYRAIVQEGPRPYYSARQTELATIGSLTFFKDPWGTPWNYYHPVPPQPSSLSVYNNGSGSITTAYASGGQMNSATYDLFSFGPDGTTYILGASAASWRQDYTLPSSSLDDITNWRQ